MDCFDVVAHKGDVTNEDHRKKEILYKACVYGGSMLGSAPFAYAFYAGLIFKVSEFIWSVFFTISSLVSFLPAIWIYFRKKELKYHSFKETYRHLAFDTVAGIIMSAMVLAMCMFVWTIIAFAVLNASKILGFTN